MVLHNSLNELKTNKIKRGYTMFKINSNELQKSIEVVEKVKNRNKYSTVLNTIHCTIENDVIEFIKTDMHMSIFKRITDIENDIEAKFLINNPSQLVKVLKQQKNQELFCNVYQDEFNQDMLEIKNQKKHTFNLCCANVFDFPDVEREIEGTKIQVNTKEFIKQVSSITYSASTDTIKPIFNAIYLKHENGAMVAVTTDSRRLSKANIELMNVEIKNDIHDCIVPLKTIKTTLDLLKKITSEEITLIYNNKNIKIVCDDNLFIISEVVSGTFVQYQQVIPQSFETEIHGLSKKEILAGLESIKIFTREPAYKIILDFKDNEIQFSANTPELGSADFKMKHEIESSCIMGVNATFLIEALKNIDSEYVSIKINNGMSPIIISGKDDNPIAVIMPIQIQLP